MSYRLTSLPCSHMYDTGSLTVSAITSLSLLAVTCQLQRSKVVCPMCLGFLSTSLYIQVYVPVAVPLVCCSVQLSVLIVLMHVFVFLALWLQIALQQLRTATEKRRAKVDARWTARLTSDADAHAAALGKIRTPTAPTCANGGFANAVRLINHVHALPRIPCVRMTCIPMRASLHVPVHVRMCVHREAACASQTATRRL